MRSTLRAVGGAAGTDEKIRLVVKMLLAANGMTTLDLGRQLGLGRTPIYDRMQGRKPFTAAEVSALAEYFGVSVAVFFAGPGALLGTASVQKTGGENTLRYSRTSGERVTQIGRAA